MKIIKMYSISDLKYYITLGKIESFIFKFHLNKPEFWEWVTYILHGLLQEMMQEISCENFNSRLAKNPFQEKTEKLPDQ